LIWEAISLAYPHSWGLKSLVLPWRDWEGELGGRESQKTCQEEPLIFFGLRMGAGVERIFQPAILRPMAGFFMVELRLEADRVRVVQGK